MTLRALLAVALFVGFYALGIAVAAAFLWLPWAQMHYTGTVELSGMVSTVGAFYVLWALVPPRTRWTAPGPELSAASEPRLHALIASVADKTGHRMPQATYLVREASAFAGSRPRWHGLRREPILGLGLPLFALLTEDELAAVIGHEFGHHIGGDVKLGPWQHRTSAAISAALHRLDGSNVYLHLPFYAYGRLFLRVTGRASREQELRADALAARTVSARAVGGALVALEQYDSAWAAFWYDVFVPAVNAGFRGPILDGYQRYLSATSAPAAGGASRRGPPAEGDTHPPLEVRLAALGIGASEPREGPSSLQLLQDVAATELHVLTPLLKDASVLARLVPVSWDEWGPRILPAIWEGLMEARKEALRQVTLASLPALLANEATWWVRLRSGINVYSPEARRRQLRVWLGQWAALSLRSAGFVVTSPVGARVVMERGLVRIEPFRWVEDLGSGARKEEEWRALVGDLARL